MVHIYWTQHESLACWIQHSILHHRSSVILRVFSSHWWCRRSGSAAARFKDATTRDRKTSVSAQAQQILVKVIFWSLTHKLVFIASNSVIKPPGLIHQLLPAASGFIPTNIADPKLQKQFWRMNNKTFVTECLPLTFTDSGLTQVPHSNLEDLLHLHDRFKYEYKNTVI